MSAERGEAGGGSGTRSLRDVATNHQRQSTIATTRRCDAPLFTPLYFNLAESGRAGSPNRVASETQIHSLSILNQVEDEEGKGGSEVRLVVVEELARLVRGRLELGVGYESEKTWN